MVGKKPQKIKTQSDYLSDSESSEDEVNPHLRTSQEERLYGTVKGSTQVTQAALAHPMVQCNPMVEQGPPKQPKIKKIHKHRHQTKICSPRTRTSHCDILTLLSNILCFIYQNIFVTLFSPVYLHPK